MPHHAIAQMTKMASAKRSWREPGHRARLDSRPGTVMSGSHLRLGGFTRSGDALHGLRGTRRAYRLIVG